MATMKRLISLLFVAAACGTPPPVTREGSVTNDFAPQLQGATLVHFGSTWINPSSAGVVAPDLSGGFTVPADALAVTAFLDLDGDRQLDVDREPHAPCVPGEKWSCELSPVTIRVHRRSRLRNGDWQQTMFVVGDAFDFASGEREPAFDLCRGEDCATRRVIGFANASDRSHALTLCEWAETPPTSPFSLSYRVGDRGGTVDVTPPSQQTVRHTTQVQEDEARLVFEADQPINRAVAWAGKIADDHVQEVIWHSEVARTGRILDERRFEVTLPIAILDNGVTLVVQIVHIDASASDPNLELYTNNEYLLSGESLR